MADVDYLALYQKDQAGANLNGAQGVSPSSAVQAFKAAPATGVAPSLGMTDPSSVTALSQQQRDQEFLNLHPPIAKFASKSPAHVAATREDWGTLGKLSDIVTRIGDRNPFAIMGRNLAAPAIENFQSLMAAKKTLDATPEGTPEHLNALAQYDAAASGLTFSPLSGVANIFSKPLSDIAAQVPFLRKPGETPEEASKGINVGANIAVQLGLPFARIPRAEPRPIVDLGTATVVGPRRLPAPREPVVDAEFEPLKPPGVDPSHTPAYTDAAKKDVQGATEIQDTLAGTKFHAELPALSAEFLDTTPMAGRQVYVDPQAILKAYSEGHTVLPEFAKEIGAALEAGRDVAIPESAFHADLAGKPYAEAINAATRFREGGVSLDEAEALGEVKPPVEVATPETFLKENALEVSPSDFYEFSDTAPHEMSAVISPEGKLYMFDASKGVGHPAFYEAVGRDIKGWVDITGFRDDVTAAGTLFTPAQQRVLKEFTAKKGARRFEAFDHAAQRESAVPEDVRATPTEVTVSDTKGDKYPIQGEPLPEKGLAPANLMGDGKVYVGPPNTLHFEIAEKFPATEGNEVLETGFVTPDGQFLGRKEAADWVRANEGAIKPSENMGGAIDALDYREQVPLSARKGKTQTPVSQRAPIPEDVRESVPRELPALVDKSVEEVFAELSLKSLFAEPKAAGLTKPQFERYDAQLAEAKAAATERVLKRTYDQIRRERTPEWMASVAAQAAVVEDEVTSHPAVIARQELQYGEGPRGEPLERPGVKFNRGEFVDAYGAATADALPRSMFSQDGMHPDEVAPLFRYDTGAELVSGLLDLEAGREAGGHASSREHLKSVIKTEAENRARAALGYDVSREGLMAAAREAAVLPQVEDFLEQNLREIADLIGLPFQKGQVEQIALRQFDALPVREAVNVRAFERGMWKTGNKTQVALEKGDWPAAFVGRQQQLINLYQLKAAHFLARKVTQAEKKFRRLARKDTIRGLSQPFLNQLHTYLPGFGFPNGREPTELAESLQGVTLPDFVTEVQETNAAFPDLPDVQPATLQSLSVDDFWKVRHFIYAMDRYGRELQMDNARGKRGAFEAQREAALASVPPGKPPRVVTADQEGRTPQEKFLAFIRWADALHRKPADMVEWLDRGDPLGVWHQNVIAPMYRGSDMEGKLHRDIYDPLVRMWEKIPNATKRAYATKLPSPFTIGGGQPIEMYRRNVLPLALYTGAPDRLTKAAEGLGVTTDVLVDWINLHITPEEANLVEAVWEKFEELAPQVSEALRRMTGVGLERVETAPVRLAGHTLRGGYVPLEYDNRPSLNPRVAEWEKEKLANLTPDGIEWLFGEVLPNRGFSQEVTNFTGVVNMELGRLTRLFNSHIKYAAYAEAVSDVRKFVFDPLIAATIEQKFGPEYLDVIPGWLNGVVRPVQISDGNLAGLDKAAEFIGRNMTVATLGFSYGTLVSQTAGWLNGVGVLSEGNLLRGGLRMFGGTADLIDLIRRGGFAGFHEMFEASEMMRQRYGTLEQNMTEALTEADAIAVRSGFNRAMIHLERRAFHLIGWTEFISASGPIWLAARKAALAEGKSLEIAARFADRMVVKSQGGGRRVDLSAIQRARGIVKLMYAYQSYFNQQYQLMVDVTRNARGGGQGPPIPPSVEGLEAEMGPEGEWTVPEKAKYNHAQAAILALTVFILSGVASNFLTHRKQKWTDPLINLFRPIFGLNTVAYNLDQNFEFKDGKVTAKSNRAEGLGDDQLSQAVRLLTQNLYNANAVLNGKKPYRPVQSAIQAPGAFVRVPGLAQAARALEYLYERSTGEQAPRDGKEWTDTMTGLRFGPRPGQKVAQRRTRQRRRRSRR